MSNQNQPAGDDALRFETNAHGDRYIARLNHDDFHHTHAAESYRQRFGEALWQPGTLYVVMGCDSGLLPRYIAEHGLPEGSRYLFIELDELIPHLPPLDHPWGGRLEIAPFSRWQEALGAMEMSKYAYAGRVMTLRAASAQPNRFEGYAPLTATLEQELRQMLWSAQAQFDMSVHIKTQLANLAENCFPAACLRGSFEGRTACLVGAGPSLDELLPWILEHRDEMAVVCVSRVAGMLAERGVVPDLVVTADPQNLSFTVYKKMLELGERTVLVHSNSASPRLVAQWWGPSLYLNSEYPWQRDEKNDNLSAHPPTVTNTALQIMIEMGFSRIVMAGVDLCYSQQGHSHAEGSIERDNGPLTVHVELTVPTNDGRQAETNRGYYAALEAFAKQAAEARERGCRIINPAPGAARIDGVEHMPAQRIEIAAPLERPAFERIAERLPADGPEVRRELYRQKIATIDHTLHKLRKMNTLAGRALRLNERLPSSDGQSLDPKRKRQLDRIERHLGRAYPALDKMIKIFNGRGFARMFDGKGDHERTIDDVIAQGRCYYEAYQEGIDRFITHLSRCRFRVESRLGEESDDPDFDTLLEHWVNYGEPGRARVWRKRHPDHYARLDEATRARFDRLMEQFRKESEEDDAQYKAFNRGEEAFALIMSQVVDRAIEQFQQRRRDGLQRLRDGLRLRQEPQAREIATLIEGFLCELDNRLDEAMERYGALDGDALWLTRQFGLERTLELQMNREDLEGALATLAALSEKIDSYATFRAQLLELTGRINEAGDLYAELIKQHPDDMELAGEYGQFLVRHRAYEGAEAILGHMKSRNPDHPQTSALALALAQHMDAAGQRG